MRGQDTKQTLENELVVTSDGHLIKYKIGMASSDKPQRGRPKRAELPDVNINTGAQSINTESLFKQQQQQ